MLSIKENDFYEKMEKLNNYYNDFYGNYIGEKIKKKQMNALCILTLLFEEQLKNKKTLLECEVTGKEIVDNCMCFFEPDLDDVEKIVKYSKATAKVINKLDKYCQLKLDGDYRVVIADAILKINLC